MRPVQLSEPPRRSFTFTKVLSREEDTLSIEALAMNREQRMVRKGFFTLLLGLGGLWLLWTQYRARERNTAAITLGMAVVYSALILFASINKPCINCGSARFGHSFWQSPVGLSGSSGHPSPGIRPLQTLPKNLLIMKLALTPETGPAGDRRPVTRALPQP